MGMNLRDYIQHYIHCDFYLTQRDIKTKITNYWPTQSIDDEFCVGYGLDGVNGVEDIRYMKPILRKLENITDEEIKELIGWDKMRQLYVDVSFEKQQYGVSVYYKVNTEHGPYPQSYDIHFGNPTPYETIFLLSKGFDLFGLIKLDGAIDASTLTK